MRRWWMTLAAAAGLVASGMAQAQVQTPGPFGSITAYYGFRGGTESDFAAGLGATTPGRALGGTVHGGYRFGDFDLALGLSGATLSTHAATTGGFTGTASARFFAVDLEGGYNIAAGSLGIRPFIGARYANWRHNHSLTVLGGSTNLDTWGIGPRAGVDGAVRLSEMFSLFAGGSGSVLFGRYSEAGFFNAAIPPSNGSGPRTIFNLDAKIGVAFEPIPLLTIAAGYRVDWWNGVDLASWSSLGGGPGSGRGNRFIHGPFVRLAYNIGAPGPQMAPPPPPAMVVNGKAYMVFFDFDRSNITPTAATTIKQVAAQAKAGQSARVGVTGHADRSGSDAYNMALSLRRANAVKDQLVREGIPAAAIAVVGRGESQPLVQTPDGVREPQNRRVEIVLQ